MAERRGLLTLVIPEQEVTVRDQSADWHRFIGKLADSPNFNGDPVEIQRKLRDDWN